MFFGRLEKFHFRDIFWKMYMPHDLFIEKKYVPYEFFFQKKVCTSNFCCSNSFCPVVFFTDPVSVKFYTLLNLLFMNAGYFW